MKQIFFLTAALLCLFLPARAAQPTVISIQTDHTQLVLTVDTDGNLRTRHYGARIADPGLFLGMDTQARRPNGAGPMALPTTGGVFVGSPALHVRYADGNHNTELYYTSHQSRRKNGVSTTEIFLKDPVTALQIKLVYEAYEKEDVILAHTEITNSGKKPVELLDYASSAMHFEADRYLLTHTWGGWASEMQVDRELLGHDTKVIESRRGVQATQRNNPSFMLSLGTAEFSETAGDVIAGALAWSGNFRLTFDRDDAGRLHVLAGISPHAATYPLAPGKTFVTPDMVWTFSGTGAGQASRNLHRWARNWGVYGGGQIHPTLLNSWEGAYFTFTTETLLRMIDDAAGMGLEMFVLDDGWFAKDYPRNGDNAGLGDWEVNTAKLPEGIDYVASYAHGKGLKFGIWIEPEMVNPQSNLAHNHPEWVVKSPGRTIYQERNQWVLDLSNPAVQDFVFGIFDGVMKLSKNIDYVKWDCNRVIESFGSTYLGKEQDRFYVEYCQGLYSVMQRIREKYPDVLIQCCSSGGGRVDYGALRYFDEIWTSDNTDGDCRAYIQYATNLIYPPFIMGAHVSAVPNHQSGNVTPLKFRFDMACAGRLGLELQPKNFPAHERALAERCIASYYQYRDLVFTGDLYRLSSPYDSDYYALMYVSPDQSRAVVYTYCMRYQHRAGSQHSFRLDGLDPKRNYRVKELNVDRSCWWGDGKEFSGAFLGTGAFNPDLPQKYSSAVFYLEAK
ncbi:MAG: alpha-galactosidase [Bacteroidales bacterium]|nr:alpha-galactosidase [Bacteroidales bacterium]